MPAKVGVSPQGVLWGFFRIGSLWVEQGWGPGKWVKWVVLLYGIFFRYAKQQQQQPNQTKPDKQTPQQIKQSSVSWYAQLEQWFTLLVLCVQGKGINASYWEGLSEGRANQLCLLCLRLYYGLKETLFRRNTGLRCLVHMGTHIRTQEWRQQYARPHEITDHTFVPMLHISCPFYLCWGSVLGSILPTWYR